MSCKELVELVTDYLEDALPREEQEQFEEHLAICHGCVTYVEQMRATVVAVGTLREEDIPPATRDELLVIFRDWKHR